jgi:hypothetical protein
VRLARTLVPRNEQLSHPETITDLDVMEDKTAYETLVDELSECDFLVANPQKIDTFSVGSELGDLGGDLVGFGLGQVQAAGQDSQSNLAKGQLDGYSNQNGE